MNEILNVKVHRFDKVDNDSNTRAICDLMFGDLFLIKGFAIKESQKGLYITMPQAKGENEFCDACGSETQVYNVFSPATPEIKEYLKEVILEAFNEA